LGQKRIRQAIARIVVGPRLRSVVNAGVNNKFIEDQPMTKRGQNEGSIYQRKDGRWAAVANLGYRNGKRWRKSFYGKTRKEVQEQLTSALKGLQEGQAPVPEKQTVGQFLDYWLENSAKQKLRPRTYVRYEEHIRLHIKPTIGRNKGNYSTHPINSPTTPYRHHI
jgi:hypothetical protein